MDRETLKKKISNLEGNIRDEHRGRRAEKKRGRKRKGAMDLSAANMKLRALKKKLKEAERDEHTDVPEMRA